MNPTSEAQIIYDHPASDPIRLRPAGSGGAFIDVGRTGSYLVDVEDFILALRRVKELNEDPA